MDADLDRKVVVVGSSRRGTSHILSPLSFRLGSRTGRVDAGALQNPEYVPRLPDFVDIWI